MRKDKGVNGDLDRLHLRLAPDFVFCFASVAVKNLPTHRCFLLPGGFFLLVPFRAHTIEGMIGDWDEAVTDLNRGITDKEKGVNAIT